MIIVQLRGGLGNQMFQYGLGRKLAIHMDTDLKFDLSALERDSKREYSLGAFNIKESFASEDEIRFLSLASGTFFERLHLWFLRRFLKRDCMYAHIEESERFGYQADLFERKENLYLLGFWQNYHYLLSIRDILLKEFSLKSDFSDLGNSYFERIKKTNAVSLHVRRGDYAQEPVTRKYHGLCPIEYYVEAIEHVLKAHPDAHFFAFSDDPQWVKDNLSVIKDLEVVEYDCKNKSHEDLMLMRSCKHHIIANSTFSWWGAWLSEHKSKMVIYPRKWFAGSDQDVSGLIPDDWSRI